MILFLTEKMSKTMAIAAAPPSLWPGLRPLPSLFESQHLCLLPAGSPQNQVAIVEFVQRIHGQCGAGDISRLGLQ